MNALVQQLDPALLELLEGNPEDEIEAIIRLDPRAPAPPGVRLVARMGDVATCRLPRGRILETRAAEPVESLKARRFLTAERAGVDVERPLPAARDGRRPEGLEPTGRGTIVGVVDWGCDFAHPDFRHAVGTTRLLALWDQRGPSEARSPAPYGYGRLHTPAAINRALETDKPYEALGYHPADGDPDGSGSHGTHVLSIAAGNGRGGGPVGLAPEAEIVFVHLAARQTPRLESLGDSVTVLEAVDFVARMAGHRPWVVNLSVGRCGGPHDGSTLVEQGFDNLLAGGDGRCIVQSCGNYYDARTHAAGRLSPGGEHVLRWRVDTADVTPNELEIWYPARDRFMLELVPPDGGAPVRLGPGESAPLSANGREIGRAYHRRHDPNNTNHHVDTFLDPGGPAGAWHIRLIGEDVVDGRFHAWVERDAGCPSCQSRFDRDDSDSDSTTGTICNGLRTIAVGAYDAHSPERPLAHFSSSGPTLDGRQKPDCLAPGVRVLAARSAPAGAAGPGEAPLYTRKSGTSMAAPYATGLVACMYEAAARPLAVAEIRSALATTAEPGGTQVPQARAGSGYLNVEAAVEAARRLGRRAPLRRPVRRRRGATVPAATPVLASGALYAPASANGSSLLESAVAEAAEANGPPPELLEPADVFDSLAYGRLPTLRPYYERLFEVVAAPGESVEEPLQPGDLLISRGLGEGKLSHVSRLTTGSTLEASDLEQAGLAAESSGGGLFVEVDEEGGLARRLGDELGRLGPDRMIVRVRGNGFARGAIEADLEPESGAPSVPAPVAAATFTLRVDADRDGTVDSGAAPSGPWQFGAAGKGAIILVNNDDDGVNGRPDNEDPATDIGNDSVELAPLTIERSGVPAPGTQLDLIVDNPDRIRILSMRMAGGAELIGPTTGASHRFPNLTPQRFELGMEAIRYAGMLFNGEITITLRTTAPSGAVTDQSVVVRVAPWIVASHVDDAEKVFVVDAGNSNKRLRQDLKTMVTAGGCSLVEFASGDIWMQDCMEIGFSNLPNAGLRTALRVPRPRPLEVFPPSLLDADFGFASVGVTPADNSFNYGGNIEATPPVTTAAGKRFPFGRLYYGPGVPRDQMDPDLRALLRRQVVQEPVEVDTSWLTVGHVDECISIVPAPGRKGFKLVLACPALAYKILDTLNRTHPNTRMLLGRTFPVDVTGTDFDVEQTVSAFLGLRDDFHPDLQANIADALVFYTPKSLRAYNQDRQQDINRLRTTLLPALGLGANDVVEIPAVYFPNPSVPPLADALVGAMINMLVINKHCIIPKPFGPVVNGVDQFEKDVRDKFQALGLTVDFLDTWHEYHVKLGEIHCGTYALRKPTAVRWWEFQP